MKILVVEDNYDKVRKIHAIFSSDKPIIKSCLSSSEAKYILEREFYDIVIVDIQIPDIEGGDISITGGVDLLSYIETSPEIKKPGYIIGLTQFNDNSSEIKQIFEEFGWPLYNLTNDYTIWSKILQNKYQSLSQNVHHLKADIAIITALEHTELEAVLKAKEGWTITDIDGHKYHQLDLVTNSGKVIKLVAAASERMGVSAAAILTTRLGLLFSPSLMIMCGICAGVEGKVALGDVVVADHTWDWNSGKIVEKDGDMKFLPDPHQIPLARNLRNVIKTYGLDCPYSQSMYDEWSGNRGKNHPKIHLAPMACGSQVIANKSIIEQIQDDNRKVLALEMESYGFLLACDSINTPAFVAKSVCDFADSGKADDAHEYASYTSASFAFKFVEEHFTSLFY
ncbi:response regulator [bacterium]|nr:response regulator [bacterium]